jgi:hypothetical protein
MATISVVGRHVRRTIWQRVLRMVYAKISERSHVFRQARELVGLARSERVLVKYWGRSGPIMATDRGFYWGLRTAATRIGWEQVARADWDAESGTLTMRGLLPGAPRELAFDVDRGDIAALVTDRVAATHVVSTRVPLDGYGEASVIGRRKPGTDDLVWLVVLPDGRSPRAPGVDRAVDRALAALKREVSAA